MTEKENLHWANTMVIKITVIGKKSSMDAKTSGNVQGEKRNLNSF